MKGLVRSLNCGQQWNNKIYTEMIFIFAPTRTGLVSLESAQNSKNYFNYIIY